MYSRCSKCSRLSKRLRADRGSPVLQLLLYNLSHRVLWVSLVNASEQFIFLVHACGALLDVCVCDDSLLERLFYVLASISPTYTSAMH